MELLGMDVLEVLGASSPDFAGGDRDFPDSAPGDDPGLQAAAGSQICAEFEEI